MFDIKITSDSKFPNLEPDFHPIIKTKFTSKFRTKFLSKSNIIPSELLLNVVNVFQAEGNFSSYLCVACRIQEETYDEFRELFGCPECRWLNKNNIDRLRLINGHLHMEILICNIHFPG